MATDWLCSLVPDHGDVDDNRDDDDDDDRDNDDDNDVDDYDGDDDHGESCFFIREHVETSSGPYPGAKIIVWAITWRENREGDDVENREGDDSTMYSTANPLRCVIYA